MNVFRREGKNHTKTLHRVVAEHFCEGRSEDTEVSHLDGVKTNCAASNLVWETNQQNIDRTHDHGTAPTGVRNPRAKLTQEIADGMRVRHAAGESLSSMAREYGVSVTVVWSICHRKSWIGRRSKP